MPIKSQVNYVNAMTSGKVNSMKRPRNVSRECAAAKKGDSESAKRELMTAD